MPELPEVQGVLKTLEPKVKGRKIIKTTISEKVKESKAKGKECIIKKQTVEFFEKNTIGLTIDSLERRAKYLNFHLSKEGQKFSIVGHLGMTGAWFVVNDIQEIQGDKYKNNIHCIFEMDNGKKMIYSDQRRFGEMRLLNREEYCLFKPLLDLAPEPFDEGALEHFLMSSVEKKYQTWEIHRAIMYPSILVGSGNIYTSEGLHISGISPMRRVCELTEKEKTLIFQNIVLVLNRGLEKGGTSFSDYVNADGEKGSFQDEMKVYGRKGKPCKQCGTNIVAVEINKRNAFYCPCCQQ